MSTSPVSFIISTYNGLALLKQNLPSVIDQARTGDEILIADDHSTDLTSPYFINKYNLELIADNNDYQHYRAQKIPFGSKKLTLSLIVNKYNLRFGANNNQAAVLALHDLIFILNNDCAPQTGCLTALLNAFTNSSEVFAVTCREISPENKYPTQGKNQLFFKRGRWQHAPAAGDAETWTSGPTAWASGGSTLYDRRQFLAFGGFDARYYPAYWEDIDLSFQARQAGKQVLYENTAVVLHNHETTNQGVFGQHKIDQMSWQNGSKFTWKNSTFSQKLQFILWQPYWFARRQPFWLLLILIIIIAAISRLIYLGQIPAGITWDEAAIGYNGWNLWRTRRDEWLTKLPISFKSFSDYKAPLAIYLSGIFTNLLGLTPFVVRLPFALASILTILATALVTKEFFNQQQNPRAKKYSLLTALVMTFTPWHFFFSRVGFEVGLALCLIMWGIYFFLLFRRHTTESHQGRWSYWWQLVVSGLCFTASMYAYHSSKIVAPLLFIILILRGFKNRLNKYFLPIVTAVFVVLLSLAPMAFDLIHGQGLARGGNMILMADNLSWLDKAQQLGQNFLSLLSPQFLTNGQLGPDGLLHATGGHWGVLLLPTFVLASIGFLGGLINIFFKKNKTLHNNWLWSLIIIILGLLPAALVPEIPHANRSLLALPGFLLLMLVGLEWLIKLAKPKFTALVTRSLLLTTMLITTFFGIGYWHYYFQVYPTQSDQAYYSQYLPAAQVAADYESQVKKIKFTNEYTQAYIFNLFARQTSNYDWQYGALQKYQFVDQFSASDLAEDQALLVVGQSDFDQLPAEAAFLELAGQNGQTQFRFYLTPALETNHD